MNIFDYPWINTLIVAIPSIILAYIGYRRAMNLDRITEQSGVAEAKGEAVSQVIDGLNRLVDNLQEDNKIMRESMADLANKLREVTNERDAIARELNQLKKKYNIE